MKQLLAALKALPQYSALADCLRQGQSVALTGIGQINRSHLLAGLLSESRQPIVVVCQDDLTAKRLESELSAFLGENFPILPTRELTLYDSIGVSRNWEQKRLRQLYDLLSGKTQLQILSWEALSLRTMPPEALNKAVFTLTVGEEYSLSELSDRLNDCG